MNKTINISSEQSKVLARDKEFIYIEPMSTQPDANGNFHSDNGNTIVNEKMVVALMNECRFSIGEKLRVRYSLLNITGCDILESVSAVVKEILEPKLVQDLTYKEIFDIGIYAFSGGIEKGGPDIGIFKDWFNRQFSKPQPVECSCVKRLPPAYRCIDCDKDGVSHYICYACDEESGECVFQNLVKGNLINGLYKGKGLKIIVDPWVQPVRVGE